MDALPSELLVEIFSFLDVGQLIELCQVCTRWQTTIEQCIWRVKRTITEADLGVYSSFESKLTRLIYFLKKLPNIDYYFFPTLVSEWNEHQDPSMDQGIREETKECFMQLHVLLKELLREGRIPVHLDAIYFIDNMIDSLRSKKEMGLGGWTEDVFKPRRFESECSITKCRSIIVPTWPPDECQGQANSRWLKYLIVKMGSNLDEIVIEKMTTRFYAAASHGNEWPSLQVKVARAIQRPSRVRILSVVGDNRHVDSRFIPSVRLRSGCQLFTYDEFDSLLDMLRRFNGVEGLILLLDKLQSEGRVLDCQIAESECKYQPQLKVEDLLNCFDDEQVNEWPHYQRLLRQMAKSTINHLNVDIDVPDFSFDFLLDDPFRGLTQLNIELKAWFDDDDDDDDIKAEVMYVWNCLLQEDILARLKSLHVYFGGCISNMTRGSRVFAAADRTIALPRLESLDLHEHGSVAHGCSLLRSAPNLRRLRFSMHGLASDVTSRDMLLSAISQLTSVVSLTIELREPMHTKRRKATCSWMTPPSPSTSVHLREEVFVALSKLAHLELLSISFPSCLFRGSISNRFYSPSLEHDMQRLTAMLPRLRVLVLCDKMFKERV